MVRPIMRDIFFLRQKAQPATKEDKQIVQDLLDTLKANEAGCVGMAANMIGVNKRIIAVNMGFINVAMLNPVIVKKSGAYETEEGCLSLDGVRKTTRYENIEVEFQDISFHKQRQKYSGWTAQIIQHEIDHCDGIKIRREAETMYQKLMTCLESVREKTDFKPEIALVLGSGLGDFAERIQIEQIIKYTDIEGFPVSTVKGHKGRFVFGYVEKTPVVIMQGRVHYYEGYPMSDVVLPTRLMGLLGAKKLLLTNAAGGANPSFHPGDLMMITDHITTAVPSPLIGPNIDELGTRFPDMSEVYSLRLQDVIRKCAVECGIELQKGVYVQFTGPNYETPAEIRLAQRWGGDAVGMSTACEAMAARHMGMEVCGISCITNMAAGISKEALNHEEVQETADRVAKSFQKLVEKVVVNM